MSWCQIVWFYKLFKANSRSWYFYKQNLKGGGVKRRGAFMTCNFSQLSNFSRFLSFFFFFSCRSSPFCSRNRHLSTGNIFSRLSLQYPSQIFTIKLLSLSSNHVKVNRMSRLFVQGSSFWNAQVSVAVTQPVSGLPGLCSVEKIPLTLFLNGLLLVTYPCLHTHNLLHGHTKRQSTTLKDVSRLHHFTTT